MDIVQERNLAKGLGYKLWEAASEIKGELKVLAETDGPAALAVLRRLKKEFPLGRGGFEAKFELRHQGKVVGEYLYEWKRDFGVDRNAVYWSVHPFITAGEGEGSALLAFVPFHKNIKETLTEEELAMVKKVFAAIENGQELYDFTDGEDMALKGEEDEYGVPVDLYELIPITEEIRVGLFQSLIEGAETFEYDW